jgi:hypothetical protein
MIIGQGQVLPTALARGPAGENGPALTPHTARMVPEFREPIDPVHIRFPIMCRERAAENQEKPTQTRMPVPLTHIPRV